MRSPLGTLHCCGRSVQESCSGASEKPFLCSISSVRRTPIKWLQATFPAGQSQCPSSTLPVTLRAATTVYGRSFFFLLRKHKAFRKHIPALKKIKNVLMLFFYQWLMHNEVTSRAHYTFIFFVLQITLEIKRLHHFCITHFSNILLCIQPCGKAHNFKCVYVTSPQSISSLCVNEYKACHRNNKRPLVCPFTFHSCKGKSIESY